MLQRFAPICKAIYRYTGNRIEFVEILYFNVITLKLNTNGQKLFAHPFLGVLSMNYKFFCKSLTYFMYFSRLCKSFDDF